MFFWKQIQSIKKQIFNLHKDLPFLPERKKLEKVKNLFLVQKTKKFVIQISALKQAINRGLMLKSVHRVIQFNQKAWLKPYINMNTKLRKEAKNEFEKDFFKLMNNSVFGKTMENVRKHRDIKLVRTVAKRSKLVLRTKSSYNKTLFRKFVDNRNKKDKSNNE